MAFGAALLPDPGKNPVEHDSHKILAQENGVRQDFSDQLLSDSKDPGIQMAVTFSTMVRE